MPNRRGLLFIALAIVVGSLAAYLATRGRVDPAQAAGTSLASVVVAKIDIPAAARLEVIQLEVVSWPADHLPAGVIASPAALSGRTTRRPLIAGEPVLESSLLPAGAAGGLVGLIAPSFRAVSVRVDNVIGVAGFVQPGDRVDVLATLRRVDQPNALPYSKMILQDVRVLAVDQQLEQANNADAATVSVATLEVSPEHAERLIYAAHEGRLQLALRPPGDNVPVETESAGVADVLGERVRKGPARPAGSAAKRAGPVRVGPTVQVLMGSKVENRSF